MCGSCGCNGSGCFWHKAAITLLIIGGLNWGLTGIGMLTLSNWNVVNMILGNMPMIEAIIYILVGLAALLKVFGCKCKKCQSCTCGVAPTTPPPTGNM